MTRKERTGNPVQDHKRRDAEKALAERQAETDALNKNMRRLKALRLEREAAAAKKFES